MSKTTLAILLNLFVCPGAGHFSLGRKKAGVFYGLSVGLILGSMLVGYCIMIYSRLSMMVAYTTKPVLTQSFNALQFAWQAHASYYKFGLWMLFLIWIISAIDAWRIGKEL